MIRDLIHFTILFFVTILLQLVCNRICLFNLASPFLVVYFLMRLPISLSINWTLTIAFLLGLCLDILSNTLGMFSLANVLIAVLRRPIFRLLFPRQDDLSDPVLSIKSLGSVLYFRYCVAITFFYCSLLLSIQYFSVFDLGSLALRIATSSVLSIILILGIDSLISALGEK